MAAMMAREFRAKRPEHIDPATIVARYDEISDTLMIHLNGLGQPGVSVPVSASEYFRVDPVSEEIVGFQLEDFLAATIYKGGPYLTLAESAGIDAATLDRVRAEIAARQRALAEPERNRMALEELFGSPAFMQVS